MTAIRLSLLEGVRMMLKKIALLAFALVMFAACATSHYKITTLSGENYVSVGEPDYDEDSKTYSFKNLEGNKVILNQTQIKEIQSYRD